MQFKLLPLVVVGGVTRRARGREAVLRLLWESRLDEGGSWARSLACLHQDGQGAVCGSPSNGRWSNWVQVGSQVGRWRL